MSGKDRLDDLQLGGWGIWQNEDYFRFGTDGVLLAHFARCKRSAKALDLCSGTGIVPILLLAHRKAERVEAMEIQPYLCRLMERTAKENKCEDRFGIIEGDLRDKNCLPLAHSYDLVTVNPPYEPLGRGLIGENHHKNIARREECCTLQDALAAATYLLKDGGCLCMVHRPYRLAETLAALPAYRLSPSRLRLLEPKRGEAPNLFLLEAVRCGERELKVEPCLTLHEADGSESKELKEIYRRK